MKVAAVTGAAGGIGEALARELHARGVRVAVLDLDGEGADAVAADLDGLPVAVDVTDRRAITGAIDRVEQELGPIDLYCANAGILVLGGYEVTPDDWQHIWDVNVMSHVHSAAVLVPRMIERGGGHLLHTASAAGLLAQIGSAPYGATKAAALSFAEYLAITYGNQGLRVSALCPQAVRTAMTAGHDSGGVAGLDGMLEPAEVARIAIDGVRNGDFLILPHPEVAAYARRKADDPERWIGGMQRLNARFGPSA